MATNRFSYSDDFTLKDNKVGINSSTPSEKLDVDGSIGATNFEQSGITTFSTYESYLTSDQTIKGNRVVNTSTVNSSISSKISVGIGDTLSVSQGTTIGQGNIQSLKVSNTFTPPIGGTVDRPTAPKPGAIFYNKDFRTIEYWDGNFWRQVDNITTSGRGVCSGGWNPNNSAVNASMDVFSLTSQGNAIDFGTLVQSQSQAASVSNSIRGIVAGGGPGNDTHMEYYTIASGGDGLDFANLNTGRRRAGGLGSSTRGLICGGRAPGAISAVDYTQIMTTGFAEEFGNLTTGKNGPSTVSSPTHGIITNGYGQSSIDKVTIASKGNAILVGTDMFWGGYATGGASTGTRGVWGGGYTAAAVSPYSGMSTTSVRGVDIASGGNSTEFGNLIYSQYNTYNCGTGSNVRGFWMGGAAEPLAAALYAGPHIVMMNLKSGGESEHWGDLPIGRSGCTAFSDCHGGLGGY